MAAREVTVNFFNNTRLTLRRVSESLEHGEWEVEAPFVMDSNLIGNTIDQSPSNWKSVSDGFATGTAGSAGYRVSGVPGVFLMGWDNPFVGSNSYFEVSPPGFHITRSGGNGDVAVVNWDLTGEYDPAGGPYFKAPIRWLNGLIYCFRFDAYMRYSPAPPVDVLDPGYPAPILGKWKGLAEAFPQGVDAVIAWPQGLTPGVDGHRAYFFSGDKYVRYNMDPNHEGVDPEYSTPWSIVKHWKGLDKFKNFKKLDAAIVWPEDITPGLKGKNAYFFSGDEYVHYNMDPQNEGVLGNPLKIVDHWKGIDKFKNFTHIDGALVWDNARTFFFRGTEFVTYDNVEDKVVAGPEPIISHFPD